MRKFFGQIVGIHISVCRDERLFCTIFNQRKETTPLIFYPNCIKMLGTSSENDHYLCRMERSKYVRLVSYSKLILQGNTREKRLKAFARQFIIKLCGKYTILSSSSVVICFFIANEHVKRLFLMRNSKEAFLNFVDSIGFRFVYLSLIFVGIHDSGLIILIVKYGRKLCAVNSRKMLMGCRIFYVFNSITAKNNRPIYF